MSSFKNSLSSIESKLIEPECFQKIAKLIVENSLLGIILIDKNLNMVAANSRFYEIVGYDSDQLLGQGFLDIVHSDDVKNSKKLVEKNLPAGKNTCTFEQRYVHKLGRIVPVTFRLMVDGNTGLDSRSGSYSDWDFAAATIEDIGPQLEMNLKLNEQAEQVQNLERERILSEVASGIAHEVNQPLAAISAYAESSLRLMEQGSPDLKKIQGALKKLCEQVHRASSVTERIREFARPRPRRKESCDCNVLANIARELVLNTSATKDVAISTSYATDLPQLYCDPLEVLLVVVCLMRNAIDSITSSSAQADHEIKLVTAQLENNDVLISVTDSGQGVHMSVEEDLFLPFASTKLHNIGLGLTVSQSIAHAHGGKLSYMSDSSGGTTFTLTLSPLPTSRE